MTSSHRPFGLPAAVAAAVLLSAVAGCSSPDAAASVVVPSPPAKEAALCQALAKELPDTVAGLGQVTRSPAPS